MTKRVFFIVIIFLICCGGTYFFLKPKPKTQTNKALSLIKQNNFKGAESALNKLRAEQMYFPLALYRGYLEQTRGHFRESDLYLQACLKEPIKTQRKDILIEVLMAQASNAFFEQKDEELLSLLEAAESLSLQNPFLSFYEGLTDYVHGHYAQALQGWSQFSFPDLEEGSGWTGAVIEFLFPSVWRELHFAHCLIEEGDLLSSREILEKEMHQMGDQELHHLATLLLGLTYLKEARQIPFDQRGSYYKLAHFYFERTKGLDRFPREKAQIIEHIENEAEALLLSNIPEEQHKWGFDFVHILQEWKAQKSIEKLAQQLAQRILKEKGKEYLPLCRAIRKEFNGTRFHVLITEKLLAAMAQRLKEGEIEELFPLWALVESLSPSPRLAAKQIATLTSQEIFETINRDNKQLTQTRHFIAFWEKLGRSSLERETLARDLLLHAKLFWQKEGQERKGQRLMEIAIKLSSHSHVIQKEIEAFLTRLYSQAENSNLIGRLTHIYDAMEHFQISKQELVSKSKLANHLADAQYLYLAHNYPAAKLHAGWVLKLDPHNEEAYRLLGLCAFHLGEYAKALTYLNHVSNLDENARKALMLSQVFASQEQVKRLCQIDNSDSFDEDGR